jgi:hypothetical protein
MSRLWIYSAVNAGFAVLVAVSYSLHRASGVHPLYLILLFAICSSALLNQRQLNDRFALLTLFSADYLLLFGVLDMQRLLVGVVAPDASGTPLSEPELVILAAGIAAQLGYRLASRARSTAIAGPPTDYSEALLTWGGIAVWALCTALSWNYYINIMTEASVQNQQLGLENLGAIRAMGYMVVTYGQPLSIVVLAYAWCRYRRPMLVPVLTGIVLVQLVMGFVADYKSQALLGAALVVLTRLLVDGKLPKVWVAGTVVMIAVVFPILQANRAMRFDYHLNHAQAAEEIGKTLERALATQEKATEGPNRQATFFERMSLKGSVELIVTKTGKEVAYQGGYTLMPLVAVFIPKIIWPNKPSVETGRLVTSEFNLSRSANLYTSPSHLGELYWNFGWPGAVIGLFLIGVLLGQVGVRSDLSSAVTLTRVMIVMVTLQQLIMSFESTFAAPYAVWIRSLVGIGLLHLMFAHRPMAAPAPGENSAAGSPVSAQPLPLPFENLMR